MAERAPLGGLIWRGLRGVILRNPVYKLVSLLLALGMWAWVQGQQVGEQSAWIAVNYQLPEDKVLNQEPATRLRATVRGTQAQLRELRRRTLALEVDLREFPVGVQSLDFLESEIQGLPDSLEVVALAPNNLQVELEPRWVRTVRVEVVTVGEVPEGLRVQGIRPIPERVALAGPKSILEGLDSVATQPLPLDGLRASTTLDAELALRPRTLALAEPTPVQVSVEVEPITSSRTFAAVPVVTQRPGWRPRVEEVEVVLSGPAGELDALAEDAVTLLVVVPADAEGPRLVATATSEDGARYAVHHGGGPDIVVASVEPARIPLVPEE